MSNELLISLADCGSPESIIACFLRHYPSLSAPVPIEELALAVNVNEIRELDAEGFEGALLTNEEKTSGVILYRRGASGGRKRFTIAHELGHYLIPTHKGSRQCSAADLRVYRSSDAVRRQEAEANRFAAGILMPKPWFVSDMRRMGNAELEHLLLLSERYETSLAAVANRYAELTDDCCAFVFSRNNVVSYCRTSADFPKLGVAAGDSLPREGLLDLSNVSGRIPSRWLELDSSVWLVSGTRTRRVMQQTLKQQTGFQITLLFIDRENDEVDDEEEETKEQWTPRFR